MWDGFQTAEIKTKETTIFVCRGGEGPPLLLLHGFPQSHLMWKEVAPILARGFSVVCADLRGYGRSGCPPSTSNHEPYSKRAMARDMVELMEQLGFSRFGLAGHDRGARVAYRLAFDHPERLTRLAILDAVPTAVNWQRADARFAQIMWPWSLLAQRAPLPERLLQSAADVVVDAIGSIGTPPQTGGSAPSVFSPEARAAYIETLRDAAHVHAICEDYRAGATLDRQYDEVDQSSGRRISCPVLVLWSSKGLAGNVHNDIGGPLAVWKKWAENVEGGPLNAGHFFPEELPAETAQALYRFFLPGNEFRP